MKFYLPYLLVLISTLVSALAQVAIKWKINELSAYAGSKSYQEILTNALTVSTFLLFFAIGSSFLLWVYALKDLPLSNAYSLTALSYIFVPLLSSLILHEHLSLSFVIGSLLILFGILLCLY